MQYILMLSLLFYSGCAKMCELGRVSGMIVHSDEPCIKSSDSTYNFTRLYLIFQQAIFYFEPCNI
ncbi:hypothetical protein MANES_06G171000v8 [Manihot esculenta]|uniref:Secreted protein n=1 Tax=Manihot esculenta TaxID=3983 RepID=A0A2C9VRQ9_MANES|nr:hypothetical protein MANES_06G171000v8 [Manihot esculenta]